MVLMTMIMLVVLKCNDEEEEEDSCDVRSTSQTADCLTDAVKS